MEIFVNCFDSSSCRFKEAPPFTSLQSWELTTLRIRSRYSQVFLGQQEWGQLQISCIQLMGKHWAVPHTAPLFWLMAWARLQMSQNVWDRRWRESPQRIPQPCDAFCRIPISDWQQPGSIARISVCSLLLVVRFNVPSQAFLSNQQRFPTKHHREKRELREQAQCSMGIASLTATCEKYTFG